MFSTAKCCQCSDINRNNDVDVEHLEENSLVPEKIYSKKKINGMVKDLEGQILDNSYQDYILDIGDDIYLHEESECEDLN